MIDHRDNSGRVVWGEWHDFRQEARETAFSEEEFSEADRQLYNLDEDDPLSARIKGGRYNDETYIGDDMGVSDAGGTPEERDLRNQPGRG